jgi:hypothetical protein
MADRPRRGFPYTHATVRPENGAPNFTLRLILEPYLLIKASSHLKFPVYLCWYAGRGREDGPMSNGIPREGPRFRKQKEPNI